MICHLKKEKTLKFKKKYAYYLLSGSSYISQLFGGRQNIAFLSIFL